jgi:hypothetical protein
MSSWLSGPIKRPLQKPPAILKIKHNSGFFSCCSVRLHHIIEYFNKYKKIPEMVNTDNMFDWYRPGTTETYFTERPLQIKYTRRIDYEHFHQYNDYMKLDYKGLALFIKKYFTPSEEIRGILGDIEAKYELDFNSTCVLFYRGNDKATETEIPKYEDYILRGKQLLEKGPALRFLVQSDETEFIEAMEAAFPGKCLVFRDEIRHIPKSLTTVDKVFKDDNFKFSKYYLAITLIMSKCKHVICGTGNCSLWIALFRGSCLNIQQFQKSKWIVA